MRSTGTATASALLKTKDRLRILRSRTALKHSLELMRSGLRLIEKSHPSLLRASEGISKDRVLLARSYLGKRPRRARSKPDE